MNWTSKQKQKFWNKAYQNYMNESGLSAKEFLNFIKINPFVALRIENRYTWGDGDSLDRERVRDILLQNYNFQWTN